MYTKELTLFSEDSVNISENILGQNILSLFNIGDKEIICQSNFISEEDCFNNSNNKEMIDKNFDEPNEIETVEKYAKNDSSQNDLQKNEEKKYKIPDFYSLDNIKEKYGDLFIGISKDLFEKDSRIIEAENELQLFSKKNIKNENDCVSNEQIQKNTKDNGNFNRGRKKLSDNTERKHGKYSSDNIVKKVKGLLFKNLIAFMNNILQKKIIKDLDYKKYINHLRKKENLKYLHLPIKDLLSFEISPSIRYLNANTNKFTIQKILEEERDNEVIMYILNMKFREWINIFIMKDDIKCINGFEIIRKNLPKINDLLKDVLKKYDEDYLRFFLLYLYNYERWFIIRNSRRLKEKKK
jgi:hypothetical protein